MYLGTGHLLLGRGDLQNGGGGGASEVLLQWKGGGRQSFSHT